MSEKRASIVIPNWNGKALLKECLPSVIRAVRADGGDCEIVIVDDGSSDGSVEFVQSSYPSVILVALKRRTGFMRAALTGISKSNGNLVVLLNNDMYVADAFLKPLLRHFADKDVFAVSPKILIKGDESLNEGVNFARFRFGRLDIIWPEKEGISEHRVDKPSPILYACGGAAAYDKGKLEVLGGFDSLFEPFYSEDVDLSYRAWKQGWKVIYEPSSVVIHKYQGTIGKLLSEKEIRFVKERNHFLFTWKNITDRELLIKHLFFLPVRLHRALLTGDLVFVRSFLAATKHLRKVRIKRKREKNMSRLSDKEVLQVLSGSGEKNEDTGFVTTASVSTRQRVKNSYL